MNKYEYHKKWKEKNPNYFNNWRQDNPNYFKEWMNKHPNYSRISKEKRLGRPIRKRLHPYYPYSKNDPWIKAFVNARGRCINPKRPNYKYYGGKGVKFNLSVDGIKMIWDRDCADKLNQPSIDRINPDGDYNFSNCRFIELRENVLNSRRNTKKIYPDVS